LTENGDPTPSEGVAVNLFRKKNTTKHYIIVSFQDNSIRAYTWSNCDSFGTPVSWDTIYSGQSGYIINVPNMPAGIYTNTQYFEELNSYVVLQNADVYLFPSLTYTGNIKTIDISNDIMVSLSAIKSVSSGAIYSAAKGEGVTSGSSDFLYTPYLFSKSFGERWPNLWHISKQLDNVISTWTHAKGSYLTFYNNMKFYEQFLGSYATDIIPMQGQPSPFNFTIDKDIFRISISGACNMGSDKINNQDPRTIWKEIRKGSNVWTYSGTPHSNPYNDWWNIDLISAPSVDDTIGTRNYARISDGSV